MDDILKKWNKKWKGYSLTLLFSDLEPVVLDFFKHLVFIDTNKRKHMYTATKKINPNLDVFEFHVLHAKTNKRYVITFSDIHCSLHKNEKEIKWKELFGLDLNIPQDGHLTYLIRKLLHNSNIIDFANEMAEMRGIEYGRNN